MKCVKLKAMKPHLLQARAAKKTAWLKAHGVDRVLIVYEKSSTSCSVYREDRTKP